MWEPVTTKSCIAMTLSCSGALGARAASAANTVAAVRRDGQNAARKTNAQPRTKQGDWAPADWEIMGGGLWLSQGAWRLGRC